jgi:hypothetical protein
MSDEIGSRFANAGGTAKRHEKHTDIPAIAMRLARV